MSVRVSRYRRAGVAAALVMGALSSLALLPGLFREKATLEDSKWQREYWSAVSRADIAYQAEDWAQVERALGDVSDLLPCDAAVRFNRATALTHLGRDDEAITELRQSVEFGWADTSRLETDPALNRIRNRSEFATLFTKANEIANEVIVLYVPPDLVEGSPPPLIVTFHGLGENPHGHILSWKQAADSLGAVVAAPRGIERIPGQHEVHSFRWVTPGGASDNRDVLQCKQRLEESIAVARQRVVIDENRIILAGYSQGGAVALALLVDEPGRFRGAVVEATAFSPRTLEHWTSPSTEHDVRVCVIVHEYDRMRSDGEAAFRAMTNAGINARLDVIHGADHELPLDGGARQVKAVRFMLGPNIP